MWDRVKRVARSRLEALTDKSITPEQLFRQRVEELDSKVAQANHTVLEAQRQVRELEGTLSKAEADVADWDDKIRAAVKAADDELARERIRYLQSLRLRRDGIIAQLELARAHLQKAQELREQVKLAVERQKVEAEIEFGVYRR